MTDKLIVLTANLIINQSKRIIILVLFKKIKKSKKKNYRENDL